MLLPGNEYPEQIVTSPRKPYYEGNLETRRPMLSSPHRDFQTILLSKMEVAVYPRDTVQERLLRAVGNSSWLKVANRRQNLKQRAQSDLISQIAGFEPRPRRSPPRSFVPILHNGFRIPAPKNSFMRLSQLALHGRRGGQSLSPPIRSEIRGQAPLPLHLSPNTHSPTGPRAPTDTDRIPTLYRPRFRPLFRNPSVRRPRPCGAPRTPPVPRGWPPPSAGPRTRR